MWTGGLASDPLTRIFAGTAASLSGHLLVALGAAVALISQYHMGSARRSAAESGQSGLVQSGPFALSRNPVLLGRIVMFAGLFLAFPDLVQALISAAVLAAAFMQVRTEERVLRTAFGDAYDAYMERVPRWVGRIRP
jgi:protein-S-isoprenylcysteine O-methyltransferase Ste14